MEVVLETEKRRLDEEVRIDTSKTLVRIHEGEMVSYGISLSEAPARNVVIAPKMLSGYCLAPISASLSNDESVLFPQRKVGCASDIDCPVAGSRCHVETRGYVLPSSLVFTPQNWMKPQMVNVHAYDDAVPEGLHYATITHMPAAQKVSVEITDNDAASLAIDAAVGTFRLLEGDLSWHSFTVRLSSQPHHDVRMCMSFEGAGTDNIVAQFADPKVSCHIFTTENYNAPVPVMLYAKDDDVAMGGTYAVTLLLSLYSSEKAFDRIVHRQQIIVDDDDQAGILALCPGRNSVVNCPPPMMIQLHEGGERGETVFTLSSKPLDDVVFKLLPDNGYCSMEYQKENTMQSYMAPNFNVPCREDSECRSGKCEANLALWLGRSSVSFSEHTWDIPQVVGTYAYDDDRVEVNPHRAGVHFHSTSKDGAYDINGTIAVAEIIDDDVGKIELSKSEITVAEGQSGVTYEISLQSQPRLGVTVEIKKSEQLIVIPDVLMFGVATWNKAQTVEVIAIDDDVDDGAVDSAVDLVHSIKSDDPAFAGHPDVALRVRIVDNNAIGLIISSEAVHLKEGEASSIVVVLGSVPAHDVSVTAVAQDGHCATGTLRAPHYDMPCATDSECREQSKDRTAICIHGTNVFVRKPELLFTPDNWNVPQSIIVEAYDDNADETTPFQQDGQKARHSTLLFVSESFDEVYDGLAERVDVSVDDNDVAGVRVGYEDPISGSSIYSTSAGKDDMADVYVLEGSMSEVSFSLASMPYADVTLTLSRSADDGEDSSAFLIGPEVTGSGAADAEGRIAVASSNLIAAIGIFLRKFRSRQRIWKEQLTYLRFSTLTLHPRI